MKETICIYFLSLFMIFPVYAQQAERVNSSPTEDIQKYLEETSDYSIIYSGRAEEPYYVNLINHPYHSTDEFTIGNLCYNGIVYTNVNLRYNTHREHLIVKLNNLTWGMELNTEKVNWAELDDYRIVASSDLYWENMPNNPYLILLHEGVYPIFKTAKSMLNSRINDRRVEYSFGIKEQYYICIEGVCYPIKNKRSILNLFPNKRRELDQYAKQMKLNFRRDPAEAFVELIKYYEGLSK